MERQKETSEGIVESTVALIRLWYRGIGIRLLSANQALEIATLAAVAKLEIPQLEVLAMADRSSYGDFGEAKDKVIKILNTRLENSWQNFVNKKTGSR